MRGMATIVAINTALQDEDQPIGLAMVIMSQLLGDAIAVSASNTIFIKSLLQQLKLESMRNLSPAVVKVIMSNPLVLRDFVPPSQRSEILIAFVRSVSSVFVLPIAASSIAILFAIAGEWVPISSNKTMAQTEHKKVASDIEAG